jgi:hypothetical protein
MQTELLEQTNGAVSVKFDRTRSTSESETRTPVESEMSLPVMASGKVADAWSVLLLHAENTEHSTMTAGILDSLPDPLNVTLFQRPNRVCGNRLSLCALHR